MRAERCVVSVDDDTLNVTKREDTRQDRVRSIEELQQGKLAKKFD